MLNEIEEKRKNELMRLLDAKTITDAEFAELRILTKRGIEHLQFNRIKEQ